MAWLGHWDDIWYVACGSLILDLNLRLDFQTRLSESSNHI